MDWIVVLSSEDEAKPEDRSNKGASYISATLSVAAEGPVTVSSSPLGGTTAVRTTVHQPCELSSTSTVFGLHGVDRRLDSDQLTPPHAATSLGRVDGGRDIVSSALLRDAAVMGRETSHFDAVEALLPGDTESSTGAW